MKRSLIAVAVAGILAAPAAMADTANVNVYGTVDMTFGGVTTNVGSATNVASNVSKIGFKGAEDLGDGMSAIWQIEQQIDIDNSGATTGTSPGGAGHATFAGRNSFGGLKGDSWGTVLMGKHDTPYKLVTTKFDAFHDELADNRAIMGASGAHDARLSNVLAYISPSMAGFTAIGAYVAGAELPATNATKANVYSLAGMYNNGPLDVGLAYQSIKIGTAGTGTFGAGTILDVSALNGLAVNDTTSAWELGAGYTFDAFKVEATYEKISSKIALTGADPLGRTDINLAGMYTFGDNDVKLAATRGGEVGGVANTGAKQYSFGYDHNLSKMTKVYFVYTRVSNDSATHAYGISSTGSTAGGLAPTVNGDSSSGWGIGFKHDF